MIYYNTALYQEDNFIFFRYDRIVCKKYIKNISDVIKCNTLLDLINEIDTKNMYKVRILTYSYKGFKLSLSYHNYDRHKFSSDLTDILYNNIIQWRKK